MSTWYNWSVGWSVLNEESGTGSGTLQKTYIGGMAEIAGSTPAIGAYSYYATDNLGSPRAVYNQAKALVTELDFTPYGQAYTAHDTIGITHRYTGHEWDATAALYFAPYRFYNPHIARWMSRDPLGMVDGPNVYAYVSGQAVTQRDIEGTSIIAAILLALAIGGLLASLLKLACLSAECEGCLSDCLGTAARAATELPSDEYQEWLRNAQPCMECAGSCGNLALEALNSLLDLVEPT